MSCAELQEPTTTAFFLLFAALGVRPWELGAVAEAVALKAIQAFDGGEIHLSRLSRSLNNIAWVQCPRLKPAVWSLVGVGNDIPALLLFVPNRLWDGRRRPDIQF